jgi:hypothetical protein
MKLQSVIATHCRLKLCCSECNRSFPENEMYADLDVVSRYVCQSCMLDIVIGNITEDVSQSSIES